MDIRKAKKLNTVDEYHMSDYCTWLGFIPTNLQALNPNSTTSLFHMNKVSLCPQKQRHTFKCDDFAGWVHDGAVSWDGPADRCIGIGQVNDHHLSLLTYFLPDTDELIGLHRKGAEADVGRIDSQVLELRQTIKKSSNSQFTKD